MSESWKRERLAPLAAHLAGRPGHEGVRAALNEILTNGLGVRDGELSHEVPLPEVRGRADTLFGATVFEIKSDLRREMGDVLARLPDYLRDRERATGRRFLGIATDGATWHAHELREGVLVPLAPPFPTPRDDPRALLRWLEPAVSARDELPPDPETVARELGRESLTWRRARGDLEALWARLRAHPEAALKRDLWSRLLGEVYGEENPEARGADDALFLQHTYLTVVAKTVAARVIGVETGDAESLLSGRALAAEGLRGAVESDFFDWPLLEPEGRDLVLRLARQSARFRLRDVEADVMKALYESLIERGDRHGLGEYYTPDWLAARVVAETVGNPLTDRVLDPACGSGAFLFHAGRALLAAGRAAGWSAARILAEAEARVRGLDVHPVAVIIARVTWLLAFFPVLREREGPVTVPVFLGDALQWNVPVTLDGRRVEQPVPGEATRLVVPEALAARQETYEAALAALEEGLRSKLPPARVRERIARLEGVSAADAGRMAETYAEVARLDAAGRDGIWPFVLRNVARPVWLSRPEQRADALVGNPPWIAYRHLSPRMQGRLREGSVAARLWTGGAHATQQDMSALFWARCIGLYLREGGRIGFVLPRAALDRPHYAGLRAGDYDFASARIEAAWDLDTKGGVSPLFRVPACVLFARRARPGPRPATVLRHVGQLPRRDASAEEAARHLRTEAAPWPEALDLSGQSPYRERFQNGATLYPRRFWFVEREAAGRFGGNSAAPRVRGRAGGMDKPPWSGVEPPAGPVERAFLRPVLLGESVAPFRVLCPALAVVPEERGHLLDAAGARAAGRDGLADWLAAVEAEWAAHARRGRDGRPKMTVRQRLDHQRGLRRQFPPAPVRVVYAKAGTLPAAAVVTDPALVLDHMLYWGAARGLEEARYLCAVINAEATRRRIAHRQSRGQGGARHFDNLVWGLRVPEYDAALPLHRDLAAAGEEGERAAAAVTLAEGAHFTRHRRAVREALAASGLAARLDGLVEALLGAEPA